MIIYKSNPNQARVPAGRHEGGQFTKTQLDFEAELVGFANIDDAVKTINGEMPTTKFNAKSLLRLVSTPEYQIAGQLADFFASPSLRKLYAPVLSTPVAVLKNPPDETYVPDGSLWLGGFGEVNGHGIIFINTSHPKHLKWSLLHEASHAMRKAKNRLVDGADAGQEINADQLADFAYGMTHEAPRWWDMHDNIIAHVAGGDAVYRAQVLRGIR